MITKLTVTENIAKIFSCNNDISKLNKYYQQAKDGIIKFISEEEKFTFLIWISMIRGEHSSAQKTYLITDFLNKRKITQEGDFYQLYEPLFIAESIYPELPNKEDDEIKSLAIMMYILIADYLFRTYRYLECLEYATEILKIDESNHTALFFKGLCGEAVLQYRYNMNQKTMVLIDDIYKSINPNEVHFDKKIVIDKIEHYKKIDTSGWKYIGLCFSKATKEILEDLFWSEEQKFYLANKLYINPLIEIDCYLESTNEWMPAVGISQEVKDLFDSIIKDFKFCRKKIYLYDSCSDKEKLDLVLVFNFLFSLFDKIGYLLYKYFDLDLKDHQTYLHKVFTADMNNTSIKLLDVKNQYLYSLYHISKEYSQTTSFHNPMNKVSKAIKENRNLLTHRGTIMANEDTVYDVSFHLAKVVRRCIIYTNLIFYIEEYRRNLNLPYTDLIFSDYLGNHLVQKFQ